MDLRVSEVKSSGAEERLARAYEERERLELLVYEAVAVRAAVVRGIAVDLGTKRGDGDLGAGGLSRLRYHHGGRSRSQSSPDVRHDAHVCEIRRPQGEGPTPAEVRAAPWAPVGALPMVVLSVKPRSRSTPAGARTARQGWIAVAAATCCAPQLVVAACGGHVDQASTPSAVPPEQSPPVSTEPPSTGDVVPCQAARPPTLSASGDRTCALVNGGRVACWGHAKPRPQLVVGIADAVEVATSPGFVCARLRSGAVACTGRYHYGAPESVLRGTELVAGLPAARRLAAGPYHACAIDQSGGLWCWGWGPGGELGDPQAKLSTRAARVRGVESVADVTVAARRTCALETGGRVLCWGPETPEGPEIAGTFPDACQIAAGMTVACVRRGPGRLSCWGDNTFGTLGDGLISRGPAPVDVPGVVDATDLAIGVHTVCVIRASHPIACWGLNLCRGLPAEASRALPPMLRISEPEASCEPWLLQPSEVVGSTLGERIAVGWVHARLTRRDGAVLCWGANHRSQLGDGTREYRPMPVKVVRLP